VDIGIKQGCEYFAMHDVDIIPFRKGNFYSFPLSRPIHCAPGQSKYNFNRVYIYYIGGCILISKEQYIAVNGFSNNYWGWGLEDDDMGKRIKRKFGYWDSLPTNLGLMININHPQVMNLDMTSVWKRSEDYFKIGVIKQYSDGFNTIKYTVKETYIKDHYSHYLIELILPNMPPLKPEKIVWVKKEGYVNDEHNGWVIEINNEIENSTYSWHVK